MDQRSSSATNEDKKQRSPYEEAKDVEDDTNRVPPATVGNLCHSVSRSQNSMDSSSVAAANESKKKEVSSDETPEVDQENSKRCLSPPPLLTGSEDKVACTMEEFIEALVELMAMAHATAANKNKKKRVSSDEVGYEVGFGPKDEELHRFLAEKWPKFEPIIRHVAKVCYGTGAKHKLDIVLSSQSPVAADEKKKKRVISSDEAPEVHENSKRICRESLPFLTCKQRENSGSSSRTLQFKLVFRNQIAPRMYANDEIRSESGKPLEIELCDLNGNAVISSEQWPSAPLKFFLLDGELREIIKSRKGKPSPLISDDYPNNCLQNGFCFVSEVKVTDNSSWTITKEFRLGVKIVDEKILNDYGMIEPAISRAFKVLDDRGKGSEKYHPPRLHHEVWRLEGIKENGEYHKILSSLKPPINTVGEFLDACFREGLDNMKKILKMTKSEKKWNKIYNHAMEYYTAVPTNYDPTIDLQVNNVDLVENQTANDELIGNEEQGANDELIGNEGQGNRNNDRLVEVDQQNNTLQANNDQVEANCNENSEVCEQKTNGDNQLQTTFSFDELLNVDVTEEIEAPAPHDHRGYSNTPLPPTWIL